MADKEDIQCNACHKTITSADELSTHHAPFIICLECAKKYSINRTFFVGLDLGQAADFTAVAVMECTEAKLIPPPPTSRDSFELSGIGDATGKSAVRSAVAKVTQETPIGKTYHIRFCERLEKGTAYPDIVRWISTLVTKLLTRAQVGLVVDATGVGRPIVDMFTQSGLKCVPVNVTGGQNDNFGNGVWNVPKKDLVGAAKAMLGKKLLKIDDGLEHKDVLIREIENFRIKINERTRHESYEAWRSADHDDLVFALCLVAWWALKREKASEIAPYPPVAIAGVRRLGMPASTIGKRLPGLSSDDEMPYRGEEETSL
jgi:hypothetical protein